MKRNKELKEAYRQIRFPAGVFQIRNTINNKIFIDSSNNLDKIFNRYRAELNSGGHRNKTLQQEWNEYGEENFRYEILAEIRQTDDLQADLYKEAKQLAKMYLEELQPYGDNGYH